MSLFVEFKRCREAEIVCTDSYRERSFVMLIRNFALNKVELCEPVLENAFRKEQE